MMKKLALILSLPLLMVACKKADTCNGATPTTVAPSSEIATLQTYITANHPGAIKHSSGLFYEISAAGSGGSANNCSTVTVKYEGHTTANNTSFDSNTAGVAFPLSNLILGWQIGIPLIQKGGIITLYLPPSLGYGANAVGTIPANSYLIFTITLVNVQ